jgi:hypothetical protein
MKILFLDIETFPNVAYVWGKYQQDVIRYRQQSCIACFVAKWLDGEVIAKSLLDYPDYVAGSYDDLRLVLELWKLFNEADGIVAHNGRDFDIKVCNARFIYHVLTPPSPYKTIDTKDVVKKVARFNSNKLDDLGQLLGIGKKVKTDFDLWEGCINGDRKSWARMLRYNTHDVLLLEKLYKRMLPWISNHPNRTLYDERSLCPKCGSRRTVYRGSSITSTASYQTFQCKDCGGWGRSIKRDKHSTITNV